MNKWRVYAAGIALTLGTKGYGSEYDVLRETGLFEDMELVTHFQTAEKDDLWIYRVKLNGRHEIVVIKRAEREEEA